MWPFDIKRKRREAEQRAEQQRQEDVARLQRAVADVRRETEEDLFRLLWRDRTLPPREEQLQSQSRLGRAPARPEIRQVSSNPRASWPYGSRADDLVSTTQFVSMPEDSTPPMPSHSTHHCSPTPSPSYDSPSSSSCDSSSSSSDSSSSGGWN